MKIIVSIACSLVLFASCSVDSKQDSSSNLNETIWSSYGETIANLSEAIPATQAAKMIESGENAAGLFEAEIVQSCMTMGCWMSVKGPAGDTVMVFMKDHAFFVPKDSLQGKRALFTGEAFYDTVSVELQKHLLEDAGADQAAIDAVSEPVYELAFEASGVQIADVPAGAPIAGE